MCLEVAMCLYKARVYTVYRAFLKNEAMGGAVGIAGENITRIWYLCEVSAHVEYIWVTHNTDSARTEMIIIHWWFTAK